MKTLVFAMAASLGMILASTDTVQAGHGYYSRGFYLPYSGHIHHNVNPYTATWGGGHLHYQNTSHFDYVPGGFVGHWNHYHYRPGGYIFHQQGHWDLHH